MKQAFFIFLYLNIYSCFFAAANAQELRLAISAEKELPKTLLDSLRTQASFKDYLSLKREADTLLSGFQHAGFIESELLQLHKSNDSSYEAKYFLGNRFRSIKIYYSQSDFSEEQLQGFSAEVTPAYFVLPFKIIPVTLRKLTALKTNAGNPFATLHLSGITAESKTQLKATLNVDSGNPRTVDSIVIKGYEKFPLSFLKYYGGIKKGKPFSQEKLLDQNENLNSLGFVQTIKAPEALFREESTTVYFYLEKQNNNLFDGILGFATEEETQKLEVNGYLNLELNNNLNYGEQLLLNYKADGEEQINFRARANLPYLFKTPFGLGAELKIFKRDSTFITTEQQARATYQINPWTHSYFGYKGYESSNLLNEAVAGASIEDFTSRFFIVGATYSRSQKKKMFPIKTFISTEIEIGSRKAKQKNDPQTRIVAVANTIFNLNLKASIFVQNSSSILFSDTYLINELFRFGGINSIRGFAENSIDASLFSVLNTEYRYQFNEGVYVHSIIDAGYFENSTLGLKEKLFSFGLGFGLQTKAGILRFNIANGNSQSQDFDFSNTKIHLSLSSKF